MGEGYIINFKEFPLVGSCCSAEVKLVRGCCANAGPVKSRPIPSKEPIVPTTSVNGISIWNLKYDIELFLFILKGGMKVIRIIELGRI
jgi:hypothetical protein